MSVEVTASVEGNVYAPAPNVPAVTSEAGTAPDTRVPIEVSDEPVTPAASVVPVRFPAGADLYLYELIQAKYRIS